MNLQYPTTEESLLLITFFFSKLLLINERCICAKLNTVLCAIKCSYFTFLCVLSSTSTKSNITRLLLILLRVIDCLSWIYLLRPMMMVVKCVAPFHSWKLLGLSFAIETLFVQSKCGTCWTGFSVFCQYLL